MFRKLFSRSEQKRKKLQRQIVDDQDQNETEEKETLAGSRAGLSQRQESNEANRSRVYELEPPHDVDSHLEIGKDLNEEGIPESPESRIIKRQLKGKDVVRETQSKPRDDLPYRIQRGQNVGYKGESSTETQLENGNVIELHTKSKGNFNYQSLEGDDIRLVTLLPAPDYGDSLHCTIQHTSLNNPTPYEALSYVWGGAAKQYNLYLHGYQLKITKNLSIALRYLRFVNVPRILWVDAICINQENLEERNLQVGRMQMIYDRPVRVIAWLGREERDSTAAVAKLKTFKGMTFHNTDSSFDISKEDISLHYGSLETPNDQNIWKSISALFGRAWWERIWVVQEATSCAEVVLFCGKESFDHEVLESFVKFWIKLYGKLERNDANKDFFSIKRGNPARLIKLKHHRLELTRNPDLASTFNQLLSTLTLHRKKEASDPRDKVYALLNLCSIDQDLKHLIEPDYNSSVETIYTRVAKYITLTEQNLGILYYCGLQTHNLKLPSWVPFWDVGPNSMDPLDYPVFSIYSADKNVRLDQKLLFAGVEGRMTVEGILFDVLEHIGAKCESWKISEVQLKISLWKEMLLRENKRVSLKTAAKNLDRDFETTLRIDQIINHAGHTLRGYRMRDSDQILPSLTRQIKVDQQMGVTLDGRRFVITQSGSMGIVHGDSEPGDVVCILFGCPAPCILRPHPSIPDSFLFMGTCYIHNKMDGQVVKDMKKGLLGKRQFILA